MNSRAKGKRGELEAVHLFREQGFEEARRGQQYRGGSDSPDVVGVPGLHIECKWTERLDLYGAVDQACRDAAGRSVYVVVHKRNRRDAVVIEPFDTWIERFKRDAASRDQAPKSVPHEAAGQELEAHSEGQEIPPRSEG